MKRILAIDGDFFANRTLGYLNMGDKTNNVETPEEILEFKISLKTGLLNLYKYFQPFIENIVFVCDNNSWRKEVEPFKPYYVDDSKLLGYKENRVIVKEKSTINYSNFRKFYREFIEDIKSNIIVFDIKGLEGDDNLLLLSDKISTKSDCEMIVFCTDGDLKQIVKDNVILMRNIKSKESPFGEFVLNFNKYNELFNKSLKDVFLSKQTDYNELFNMTLGNGKFERTLNKGITIANPFQVALTKSICGDKKDNLFSIMGWKSKTGNINYNITEAIISKALKKFNLEFDELTSQKIFADKDLLLNLIITIKDITNQSDANISTIIKHLKHNMKLNILTKSNIPVDYCNEFDNVYNEFEDYIINGQFNSIFLENLISKYTSNNSENSVGLDKGKSLLLNSIIE